MTPKQRLSAALVGLSLALACGPISVSPEPFRRYLAGLDPVVTVDCAMENAGNSRAGWCTVRGEPAVLARWLARLDPQPSAGPPGACSAVAEVAGGSALDVGPNRPPNPDNVRPERVFVAPDGDVACVELRFPYG